MSRYSTAPRGGCACEEGGRNEAARAGRGGECHFLHADFLPAVAACARSFAARRSCRAVACAPSYRPPSKSGGGLRRGGRTRGRRRPFSPPRYCSARPTVSPTVHNTPFPLPPPLPPFLPSPPPSSGGSSSWLAAGCWWRLLRQWRQWRRPPPRPPTTARTRGVASPTPATLAPPSGMTATRCRRGRGVPSWCRTRGPLRSSPASTVRLGVAG